MKLIVVEDEKIIRTGLLKHVPWQRLGVSEVEAAANGEGLFSHCHDPF